MSVSKTDTIYGAVAVTQMYGPDTRYRLVSVHASQEDADAAASDLDKADWDESVKAYRLANNQAAATIGEVHELIHVRTSNYGLEWDSVPAAVQDECLDRDACETQEDFERALAAAGYEVVDLEGDVYLFAR